MRRLTTVGVLVVACLLVATAAAAAQSPTVIAHRGASRSAPENTAAAIAAALASGADAVEVDVRLTRDRQLVLLHDASLARTTDVERRYPDRAPWRVADFTIGEIATLDAGIWKGPAYKGQRVPTLAMALEAVQGRAALLIELKDPQRDLGVERLVAQQLTTDGSATGTPSPRYVAMVQSFDYLSVARFAALQPDVPTGVLTRTQPSPVQLGIYASFADQVSPPHGVVTRSLLAEARQRGLRVAPYTVNEAARMRQLLRLGVHAMVTDYPARLRRVREAALN